MKSSQQTSKKIPNKQIKISSLISSNGFKIGFGQEKKHGIKYQSKIFSGLTLKDQKVLADNFVYARTRQLTFRLDNGLAYDFSRPLMADFADFGIIKDLGKIADMNQLKTKELLKSFKQAKISFSLAKQQSTIVPKKPTKAQRAILALSFGKDSLLSYGLAKELGIDCELVFVKEMETVASEQEEARHKNAIIQEFVKKEKVKMNYLYDNGDEIFLSKQLSKDIHEFDNTNGMLAFCLELLPLAYFYQAKYVILGNEANFTDSFINHDGQRAYPSFDQSIFYAKKHNQALARLTKGNLQSLSLVEPIYNLAEMHLLYHRYPNLLGYVMSCSPTKPNSERWCYDCPMCAKAWLYSRAVGGDPKKIKFTKDFFAKEYQALYPLFSKKIKRAYEKPAAVRDEQLLAFLLAYQNGAQGALIDLFVKDYLAEAKRREKVLRRKFFGIHPIQTIPKMYQKQLLDIYKQELAPYL